MISTNDVVYFGGEIINPKNNRVILYNTATNTTDTLTIDSKNRFMHKLRLQESSLYSFFHGGEYQMVLLEPGDSIMLRLNTYDFDESLVFTGFGAKKNNYLVETFLSNEKDSQALMDLSKLSPESFSKHIENNHQKKLDKLNMFLEKNELSEFSKSILNANINYNAYALKEIYPLAYFGNNFVARFNELPSDFYSHRRLVNYNAEHLSHSLQYNLFLSLIVDNMALKTYYTRNEKVFNRYDVDYNKTKLHIIDSLITNPTIKNNLLKNKTREYISLSSNLLDTKAILQLFLKKSTNIEDKTYMMDMVKSIAMLQKGARFPAIALTNFNGIQKDVTTLISKPTIVYFWSSNQKAQYRNSHYRVDELKSKFSNIDFISININDNDDVYWKKIVNQYQFPSHSEYKFTNTKASLKTLALNYLNKAIVVDSQGYILHPNVNIFNTNFEEQLASILN